MSMHGQIIIHIDRVLSFSVPEVVLHLTGDFGIDSTPCVVRMGDTITVNVDFELLGDDIGGRISPPTYLNSDVVLPVAAVIRRVLKK